MNPDRLDWLLRDAANAAPPPERLTTSEAWQRVRGRVETRPRRVSWCWFLTPTLASACAALVVATVNRTPPATAPTSVLAKPATLARVLPERSPVQPIAANRHPRAVSIAPPPEPTRSIALAKLERESEVSVAPYPATNSSIDVAATPEPAGYFDQATVIRSGDSFARRTTITMGDETPGDAEASS